jgi:hypothetical protein
MTARRLPSPKGRSAAVEEKFASWLRALALEAPPTRVVEGRARELVGAQLPVHPALNLSIHALTILLSASADPAPPTRSTSTSPP